MAEKGVIWYTNFFRLFLYLDLKEKKDFSFLVIAGKLFHYTDPKYLMPRLYDSLLGCVRVKVGAALVQV